MPQIHYRPTSIAVPLMGLLLMQHSIQPSEIPADAPRKDPQLEVDALGNFLTDKTNLDDSEQFYASLAEAVDALDPEQALSDDPEDDLRCCGCRRRSGRVVVVRRRGGATAGGGAAPKAAARAAVARGLRADEFERDEDEEDEEIEEQRRTVHRHRAVPKAKAAHKKKKALPQHYEEEYRRPAKRRLPTKQKASNDLVGRDSKVERLYARSDQRQPRRDRYDDETPQIRGNPLGRTQGLAPRKAEQPVPLKRVPQAKHRSGNVKLSQVPPRTALRTHHGIMNPQPLVTIKRVKTKYTRTVDVDNVVFEEEDVIGSQPGPIPDTPRVGESSISFNRIPDQRRLFLPLTKNEFHKANNISRISYGSRIVRILPLNTTFINGRLQRTTIRAPWPITLNTTKYQPKGCKNGTDENIIVNKTLIQMALFPFDSKSFNFSLNAPTQTNASGITPEHSDGFFAEEPFKTTAISRVTEGVSTSNNATEAVSEDSYELINVSVEEEAPSRESEPFETRTSDVDAG